MTHPALNGRVARSGQSHTAAGDEAGEVSRDVQPQSPSELRLSPRSALTLLAWLVIFCVVASFVAYATLACIGVQNLQQHPYLVPVLHRFVLDAELSVPAWYSIAMLFSCSVLLGAIAWAKRQRGESDVWYWCGLAVIFLLMAIDEQTDLHTLSARPLQEFFNLGGVLYFAWVIPGALFVIAVGLVYSRFLFRLEPRTRWLFVTAGVTFVVGALGMEMIGSGLVARTGGVTSPIYFLSSMVEEFLEMVGIVVFLYALMDTMARQDIRLNLRFDSTHSDHPSISTADAVD